MRHDFRAATDRENYKAIAGYVIPRPIAWITTIDGDGLVNLAPYSFFAPMSTRPPVLGVSMSPRDGGPKDSYRNLLQTKELVINIPSAEQADVVHQTGVDYAPGVSEAEANGLELVDSELVAPPRLKGAFAAYECRYMFSIDFAPGPRWVVLEPLVAHFAPELVDERLHVDYARYRPLGRAIADGYFVGSDYVQPKRDWSVPRYADLKRAGENGAT